MRTIADFCYRKRRFIVVGWIVLLIALMFLSSTFAGKYRTKFELPGSESQSALVLMKDRGLTSRTGVQGSVVFKADDGVDSPAVKTTIQGFLNKISSEVQDIQVVDPYDPANVAERSADGKIAYAQLNFGNRPQEQYIKDAKNIKDLWKQIDQPGLQVNLGGDFFADNPAFNSEVIGIGAAVIILLLAFGSVLAMGLPIVTALFGIGCGFALIGLATRVLAVPEFTSQIAAMIGIGVGIDYSLLIVTRYRQGLHDGLEPRESVQLALDTSGRAVVFAGITVIISLLGMFMMNLDFMRSVAIGAVLAVLMTMGAAITLLPALLGFVGHKIDRWSVHSVTGIFSRGSKSAVKSTAEGDEGSFWYRWSRVIQAHPWPAFIVSTAFLVILAIPVFSLRLGFSDAGNRANTDTTRRAYDMLSEGFGPGFNSPILIVTDLPNGAADAPKIQTIADAITKTAGVAKVTPPQVIPTANLALINVFADSAPQDKKTSDLVHRLREQTLPPVERSTGLKPITSGGPPIVIDFADYIAKKLPIFFGAVLILSFLLLLMVFHSLVVPLKAVVMNMLSIGASFGAMVAVFQWGIGASLIGIGKEGPVEAWAPMMLFAIVFGLSMDYEVFLLTRVREEYDRNGNNNGKAVADGLAATGRVISAAAAIMVCVFASFILVDARAVKLIGFGLASAVLIDATVVRLVLVPAAMELMGKANWWAPSWLVRYLPTIRVDSSEPLGAHGGGGGGG